MMTLICGIASLFLTLSPTSRATAHLDAARGVQLWTPMKLRGWRENSAPGQLQSIFGHGAKNPLLLGPLTSASPIKSYVDSQATFRGLPMPFQSERGRKPDGCEGHATLRPDLNLFGLWEGFSGYTPGDHQAIFSTIYSVGLRLAWKLDAPTPKTEAHRGNPPVRSVLKTIHGPAATRAKTLDTFER